MDTAIVKEVIVTSLLRRGDGTPESPLRIITQYWDKDGTMLAEVDPLPICEENRPIIRERNALRARVAELEGETIELNKRLILARRGVGILLSAVKWALGEKGDFTPPPATGKPRPFWWRKELRQRAMLDK